MSNQKQHSSPLWTWVLVLLCTGYLCHADTETPIPANSGVSVKRRVEQKRLRFLLGLEADTVKDTKRYIGLGVQGAFMIALNRSFQVGLGMRQLMDTSPVSVLYSSLDMRLDLALSGSFSRQTTYTVIDEIETLESEELNAGGLRIYALVAQYFLRLDPQEPNGTGIGMGMYYDFPSSTSTNYYIGVRMDRVSMSSGAIYPMMGYFGISFGL